MFDKTALLVLQACARAGLEAPAASSPVEVCIQLLFRASRSSLPVNCVREHRFGDLRCAMLGA